MSEQAAAARAGALLEVGRGAEALTLLTTALAESPESYRLLCLLSRAYAQCKMPEPALDAARRAIAAQPEGATGFLLASAAYLHLGDQSQAAAAAEQAVRLTPQSSNAYVCLAIARGSMRPPPPSALEVAQQAVRLAPQSPQAHFAVGFCAQMLDRRNEAIAAYRQVLALQPDHAGALTNLGMVEARRGRLTKAAHDLRAAAAIDPGSEAARSAIDALAWRFVRRFALVVLISYAAAWIASQFALAGTTAQLAYAGIGGGGLAVLATAALVTDRRLPQALRFYYRRLLLRDRELALRVALLLMALLLVLALSVVPEGKVASSLLRVSWLCLIASGILTIVRGRRLSAGQRNDSAGRPHDVAPTGVLGAGRGTIGAAVDARALAVARRRARWLHRGTVAIFAVCLFVIAVAPCVALLTGRSLSLAALAAGGAAAMVVAPALFGLLLLLRWRRAARYLRGLEANAALGESRPVAST